MLNLSSSPNMPATFTSFPRDYYLSPEWFEREMDRLFSRQWLYAGHVSEIPRTGDFLVREVGDESIIVVRDGDKINALLNVCRHRGSVLCQEASGHASRFVCPYHRWTYGLDGRLLVAPAMPGSFDCASYPLLRVHAQCWHGMVFINLSQETPEPVDEILRTADSGFKPFDLPHCRIVHSMAYEVAANWKILLDNFMECYHCPGAHPEFCRTFDLKRNPGGILETPHLLVDFGEFMLKSGVKSSTMTGEIVCRKLMGKLSEDDLPFAVALTFRPTSSAILFGDYGVIHDFQPISSVKTRVRCQWVTTADATEGRDYAVEEVIAVWDNTNRQDWGLCEMTQKGIRSRRFAPGPNSSEQEAGVATFRSSYLAMMHEARDTTLP
jgi:glycine betaine catabolism A